MWISQVLEKIAECLQIVDESQRKIETSLGKFGSQVHELVAPYVALDCAPTLLYQRGLEKLLQRLMAEKSGGKPQERISIIEKHACSGVGLFRPLKPRLRIRRKITVRSMRFRVHNLIAG